MSDCNNCKKESQCQQYCVDCIIDEIKHNYEKKSNDYNDYDENICNQVRDKFDPNHYCPYDEFEKIDVFVGEKKDDPQSGRIRGCNVENYTNNKFVTFTPTSENITKACAEYKNIHCLPSGGSMDCCMGVERCDPRDRNCFSCKTKNLSEEVMQVCGGGGANDGRSGNGANDGRRGGDGANDGKENKLSSGELIGIIVIIVLVLGLLTFGIVRYNNKDK